MLLNTQASYGWVAIGLHWLSAFWLVGMFSLGLWMMSLDYYDAWYVRAPLVHKGAGILFVGLVMVRLVFRLASPLPDFESSVARWECRVARLVQWAFYVIMLALPVSGYLVATAKGQGVDVFGWFVVPAIIEFNDSFDRVGAIHGGLAWAIMVLAMLHVSAALKHHFFDKDKTLLKMLKPQK